MERSEIRTANDVYEFVEQLKAACLEKGAVELYKQFNDSMRLGSSGLEILGAIRGTIIANRKEIEGILGLGAREDIDHIIVFVNRAYGR
jgi:hypothetical protein